jgi:hypothetical protein
MFIVQATGERKIVGKKSETVVEKENLGFTNKI